MTSHADGRDIIDTIDFLGAGPFGDSVGIGDDKATFYRRVRSIVIEQTGVPLGRSDVAGLAVGSASRAMIDLAFRELSNGVSPRSVGELLRRTATLIDTESTVTEAPVTGSYSVALDWDRGELGRELLRVTRADLAPQTFEFQNPLAGSIAQLRAGLELLARTGGQLTSGVLACVRGAVLVRSQSVESAFIVPMPMVSVLNVRVLNDVVDTADAILHEACHQKFYDLILVRQLLRGGYRYLEGPLFDIPWTPVGGRKRQMDSLRILSTLHVYAHLSAVLGAMLDDEPSIAGRARAKLVDYWERTQFFRALAGDSEALRRSLGPDGGPFADWLLEAIDLVDIRLARHGLVADNRYVSSVLGAPVA